MDTLLLGVDSGTSVVKSVLFDLDGREVATASREMPLTHPADGWSEVDMSAAWALTAETIRAVVEQTDGAHIAAVGISGTACGFWGIDSEGAPVRSAILWNDGRAADYITQWKADGFYSAIFDATGNAPFPGYPLPLLRWLVDHEPETLARARWLLFHKDWLRWNLTGTVETDVSDVSYFPGDLFARGFAAALHDQAGLGFLHAKLPPIHESSAVVGAVTLSAAAETHLPANTPVITGAVDVVASLLGGGAFRAGQACTVLGTSMLNTLITEQPSMHPRETGVQVCIPEGRCARSLVNTSGTLCIDWMLDHLAPEAARLAAEGGSYTEIERWVLESPPGARGLIFLPYLNPSGIISPFADISARGLFFGLSSEHTRADLLRAVYEGVALAMRDCYAVVDQPLEEILLVGGGARSDFWAQLFADVTGKRIHVPAGSEFGARGAALLAGVGAGVYESMGDAVGRTVHAGRMYTPRAEFARVYDALYPLYRHLYTHSREAWALRRDILKGLAHG